MHGFRVSVKYRLRHLRRKEADLLCASGRLVGGVEVDDDGLALELVQRHGLAVLVLESEVRWHDALADLQPNHDYQINQSQRNTNPPPAYVTDDARTNTRHFRGGTLPQTMPVDAAERRQRGAGAADAGLRRPRNAEVEGVQRSAACARAAEPRDDARGASAREGLQQAAVGVNAMADGASGEASAAEAEAGGGRHADYCCCLAS